MLDPICLKIYSILRQSQNVFVFNYWAILMCFLLWAGLVLESISAGIANANEHMAEAGYGITRRGGDCGIQTKPFKQTTHICEPDSAYAVIDWDLCSRVPRNALFFTCI